MTTAGRMMSWFAELGALHVRQVGTVQFVNCTEKATLDCGAGVTEHVNPLYAYTRYDQSIDQANVFYLNVQFKQRNNILI